MLSAEQLTGALHDALKACEPPCGCFCVAGAEVTDDKQYLCFHNGVSGRSTDAVVVHAPAVLTMNQADLAICLKAWIGGLHTGKRLDLNAGKA